MRRANHPPQSERARPHGAITQALLDTLDRLEPARRAGMVEPGGAEAEEGAPDHEASADGKAGQATLGAFIDALDERAFGLMLLILAIPCALPFIPAVAQIVAVPMAAIALQMAAGRETPWLPQTLRKRHFGIGFMRGAVRVSSRYLDWLERLAQQRLQVLTDGPGVRVVGGLLLVPTILTANPLPGFNTVPGIGIVIASIGLIERDGLLVLLGLFVALGWLILLMTVGLSGLNLVLDRFF